MTDVSTKADPLDITPAEAASRGPMLLLLGCGLLWLLVSGVFALIASVQVPVPSILADCPILTVGRVQALAETAFIYGWIGNAGLGLLLWMLGRLAGEPLRAANWAVVGTLFWNLALALAEIGIAVGDGTGTPMLQIPAHLLPLLLISYGAIGVTLVLAWTARRRDRMYASQWYAGAAVFLFPWILSIGQVILVWSPARGALQAVLAGWFAQSLWTLWMAPLALAGAYYVVGRMTSRMLPSYEIAFLGFWSLLFIGGFTGGRHLIDGPVPAWIPTLAIVTTWVLLVHYVVVFLNLRPAFSGPGLPLRFIGAGLFAYALAGALDAVTSLRSIAVTTQFTTFDWAILQLGLYGGISLMLFGTLYFALPRIAGAGWASGGLARGHWLLSAAGVALLVLCLAIAGWIQGSSINDPAVTFAAIADRMRPWLLGAAAAEAILLLGNLLLTVNFFQTLIASEIARLRAGEAPAR